MLWRGKTYSLILLDYNNIQSQDYCIEIIIIRKGKLLGKRSRQLNLIDLTALLLCGIIVGLFV